MTAIPPTTSGTPAANTQMQNSKSGSLGKDDFLKLFVAQLQHQDPSSPMDTDQSMQQMASFSQVEQLTNLVSAQSQASAVGLLGKTVTYSDKTGVHTGAVDKVNTSAKGAPSLTVAGVADVDPSSITQVA